MITRITERKKSIKIIDRWGGEHYFDGSLEENEDPITQLISNLIERSLKEGYFNALAIQSQSMSDFDMPGNNVGDSGVELTATEGSSTRNATEQSPAGTNSLLDDDNEQKPIQVSNPTAGSGPDELNQAQSDLNKENQEPALDALKQAEGLGEDNQSSNENNFEAYNPESSNDDKDGVVANETPLDEGNQSLSKNDLEIDNTESSNDNNDGAVSDIKLAPTAIQGENAEKKITKQLYWINAETGEEIETITSNQKARLCFETQGYLKGEKVKAKVEWSDGEKFEDDSTELIYSGIVDENGKAISEQIWMLNEEGEAQRPIPLDFSPHGSERIDNLNSIAKNDLSNEPYSFSNDNGAIEMIEPSVGSGENRLVKDISSKSGAVPGGTDIGSKSVTTSGGTEKEITKLYWINAETGKAIGTIAPYEEARLYFETQGYQKDETVKAKIKWRSGRKFADNSTELIYSGVVDENGKAISEQVWTLNEEGGEQRLVSFDRNAYEHERINDLNSITQNDLSTDPHDLLSNDNTAIDMMKSAVDLGDNRLVTNIGSKSVATSEITEKAITQLYWINAETNEKIETINLGEIARLCFETQGYKQGEIVEVDIIWNDGRKFEDNSTKLIFSGTVDESGKATSKQTYNNSDICEIESNNDKITAENSKEKGVEVKIGRVIRGNPYVSRGAKYAGLPDSLPLNKTYQVKVEVEGKGTVDLAVINSNGSNGSATVTPSRITATTVVTIKGTGMTKEGCGGNLRIEAKVNGVVKAVSAGFSVCCHPINFVNTYKEDVYTPTRIGVVVADNWSSDNGVFSDLAGTGISEIVSYNGTHDSPPFQSKILPMNSNYLAGNKRTTDTHSMSRQGITLTAEGISEAYQLSIYKCNCCGATGIVMPNSGFKRIHRIYKNGEQWKHQTKKIGANVTIGRYSTGAGDANVSSLEHDLP